ncbi:F0F1 ATP synthase subunit epsilon [Fusibacter paucivorans]|uniref:ATP synthase epsilon chain n=1 Tax=Fusibacter paucivorans TaxID=76009 RepID=A0ABS5PL04_9FIRM|nr:F0F1 ATP synthase subunit epsilon [Fusibacter paucivorans]MBS7525808.1 F0F1 ATP synthase subunit epsilon [Fusibacter paucivorans]
MGRKFNLEVVTPDEKFFEGETDMAILRTTEGDIGILFDHEPLVAPLKIGSIRIRQDESAFRWATCSSGFLTVSDEKVTVITDAAEWVDEIDLDRAERAKERAEKRIREGANKEVDVLRAKASLERATNRIRLYSQK